MKNIKNINLIFFQVKYTFETLINAVQIPKQMVSWNLIKYNPHS